MKQIQISIVRAALSALAALLLITMFSANTPLLQAAPAAQPSQKKVNVNTADAKTLETLPGIGPTLAERIIENRPYKNLDDLGKVKGLSKSKIDALRGEITFGTAASTKKGSDTGAPQTAKKATGKEAQPASRAGKVNVNTADDKTLETLPGIGTTLAQRIIDNRPYHSVDDLGKVKGLSKSKIDAIKDQVTFGSTETAKKGKATETAKTKSGSEGVGAPTGRPGSQLAPGEKININTASAQELDTLPGIGPTKAQAIIEYREQNGNFKSIEDIMKVKGIKEGEFAKIKGNITVGP